jgi:hypothetical protein
VGDCPKADTGCGHPQRFGVRRVIAALQQQPTCRLRGAARSAMRRHGGGCARFGPDAEVTGATRKDRDARTRATQSGESSPHSKVLRVFEGFSCWRSTSHEQVLTCFIPHRRCAKCAPYYERFVTRYSPACPARGLGTQKITFYTLMAISL